MKIAIVTCFSAKWYVDVNACQNILLGDKVTTDIVLYRGILTFEAIFYTFGNYSI